MVDQAAASAKLEHPEQVASTCECKRGSTTGEQLVGEPLTTVFANHFEVYKTNRKPVLNQP